MARSVHTQPKRLRAPRRVRAPRAPRSEGDLTTERSLARCFKGAGVLLDVLPTPGASSEGKPPLPRIRVHRTRAPWRHVLEKREIVEALLFFGEPCTYGLREILLAPAPDSKSSSLHLGKLIVPGRIVLYPVRESPWRLPGRPSREVCTQLREAGASVEISDGGLHTLVSWPGDTLRDFVLFDVLMHEVGHHMLQQYKGKRCARVARTKEHEALARRFGKRCRELYRVARTGGS